MKILFTSVGRRVELMQAFRCAAEKLNIVLTIIGADITDSALALYFCDMSKRVVCIDNPKYVPQLLENCEEEKVDCLIPTIDTDLLLLAENKFREYLVSELKWAVSRIRLFLELYKQVSGKAGEHYVSKNRELPKNAIMLNVGGAAKTIYVFTVER